jgi:LysM repeat protein
MKTLRFAVLPVLLAFVLFSGFLPVFAQDSEETDTNDRTDNKILVTNVPQGWAVIVAPLGAPFPTGPGNVPDNSGNVTAYAPLNTTSYVYLWDGKQNNLIATVNPGATFPDTVINGQVQYAQALANQGLASPAQGTNQSTFGQSNLGQSSQGNFTPNANQTNLTQGTDQSNVGQFTNQYTVKAGDSLGAIAKQFGTTTSAIASANNIADPNVIRIGQVIMVP